MGKIDELKGLCQQVRWIFGTEQVIIAGGAPRDILSNVAVKDIDIFVRLPDDGNTDWFPARCEELAKVLGWKLELRPSVPEYPDIFDLADIVNTEGKGIVQVVGIYNDPVDDVVKYDFDLSQIFVTPSGVFATEAAHAARLARTITYVPSAEDVYALYRSKARLGRLRAKYDGWTFANCEPLDALPEQMPVEALTTEDVL